MTDYSPRWATTIFAAVTLHFAAALGFSLVEPKAEVVPTTEVASEFDWIDVELSDATGVDAEEISSTQENSPVQENSSPFSAQDLFVPQLPIPQVPTVEEIQPHEVKPVERQRFQLPVTEKPKVDESPKVDAPSKVEESAEAQRLEQPPVTIKEVYPEAGSGLGFKGYVSIAATVGTDGKIHETEILQSSGRYFVDEIALKAAVQWTFKPARDQNGKPMQSIKIITFDFRKFS